MDPNAFRGRLSFSIGETLLSAWEAARLAPGDIVLTTREAGYPGFLLFNNLPLGLGEVVILDQTFGVRIVDSDFRPSFQVDPGRIDQLGEMVPALIELGSLEVGLDELGGLGRHSFINLGCPFVSATDGVLMYAGRPLARGKVVVVGELMGLRIGERLADLPIPEQVRQSGNIADRDLATQAKDYRFDMPDRWSRDQIRRLGEIHKLFQRNLEASLPEAARRLEGRTDSLLVDQCTLGEARELLGPWGLGPCRTWEHEARRGRREVPRVPRTAVLEVEGCPRPWSSATHRFIEASFHLEAVAHHRPVFLHPGAWLAEEDFPVLTDCLHNGWKKYLDFRLDTEADASGGTLADTDMVILVLLKGATETPALALVYPYLTLEPYMKLLGN